MIGTRTVIAVMLILSASLFGCSGKQPQQQVHSGFLDSYPEFTEGLEGVDKRYLKPGVDFSKYTKIMMDEVIFYFKPDQDDKGINPRELAEIQDKFYTIFFETLGDKFTETPGPDVLRMRVAITDIEPSNPASGTLTTVVPVGLAVSVIKRGATGEYTGIGSASAEMEFLDSLSNERVAAAIDKAPGGKMDIDKLSPAESAFAFWAERINEFFNDLQQR